MLTSNWSLVSLWLSCNTQIVVYKNYHYNYFTLLTNLLMSKVAVYLYIIHILSRLFNVLTTLNQIQLLLAFQITSVLGTTWAWIKQCHHTQSAHLITNVTLVLATTGKKQRRVINYVSGTKNNWQNKTNNIEKQNKNGFHVFLKWCYINDQIRQPTIMA